MKRLLIPIFTVLVVGVFAQAPVIQNVDPANTFPGDTIVLTGYGFSTTKTNLEVWFDDVKGTIISSTDNSILVTVPPQAKLAPVEVINLSSKLSGKSIEKFVPSYSGSSFSAANFAAPLTFSTAEEAWDLCACDFNTDGKPDIAATKFKRGGSFFTTPTDLVLLQNTTTAGAASNPNTLSFTKFDKSNMAVLDMTRPTDNVVCGDLQGDGKPDLVVANGTANDRNSIFILRNTSAGSISFAPRVTIFMSAGNPAANIPRHNATRMAIRDLNKDGKPEIIATNTATDRFYVFLNKSSGTTLTFDSLTFSMAVVDSPTDLPEANYEVDVQDFDGDNLPDILLNQFNKANFYVMRNTSTGTISFAAPEKFEVNRNFNRLVSADFNKDGLLDVVFTSNSSHTVDVVLNKSVSGNIDFDLGQIISLSVTAGSAPWGVEVADIDGDSDADVLVATEQQINVHLNNGASTPAFTRSDINPGIPTRNIKVLDFDGDGKPDISYTGANNTTVVSHVGIIRNMNCHKPVILNDAPLAICAGQTKRLQTIPAKNVTFNWQKDGTPVGSNLHYLDITSAGSYTVTAIGEGGACSVISDPFVVTIDPSLAPADPVISNGSQFCVNTPIALTTSSAGADTYQWEGPDNFTSTSQNPASFTASPLKGGEYRLTVTKDGCTSNTVSKVIEVIDPADFWISASNNSEFICTGTSVTLTVNSATGYTFKWFNDGIDTGNTGATLNTTTGGNYTVEVSSSSVAGCKATTDPLPLIFVTQPTVSYSVTPATGCLGSDVTFASTSTNVDSRVTAIYTWTFGDTQTGTGATTTHLYAAASAGYNTSLSIRYAEVTGCQGTPANKSVPVVAPVTPVIAGPASACPDQEVDLTIAGTFTSYTWSTNETTSSITVLPGSYSVTTVDANGCSGTDDIEVTALEAPALIVTATPPEIKLGATSQLSASGADTYLWSPAEALAVGEDPASPSPIAAPLVTTTFTVTGTSTDGCVGAADIEVVVSGVLGFPVAFSPNNDGQNEIWDIGATSTPDCTLSIFDGHGRRVFEKNGENWDGTYDGKPVPEGTYYFVYGCPDKKPVTGSVLLFR